MFFAGPKAGTQRKSQALAMAQSLDLHPEADLPAPSHLLASSPLEHLPPLLSSVPPRPGFVFYIFTSQLGRGVAERGTKKEKA